MPSKLSLSMQRRKPGFRVLALVLAMLRVDKRRAEQLRLRLTEGK